MKRLGYALVSLALLSLTIFLFVRLIGDPAVLLVEPGASKADPSRSAPSSGSTGRSGAVRHLVSSLVRGDLANPSTTGRRCLELYLSRLPNSLMLALAAMAFSLLIGIPSGILAAVRVDRWWDSAGKIFALLGPVAALLLGRAWC